jgi:hypothetical protein
MSKITFEQVENWLGSDHLLSEAIETLVEIANGEYKPELFAADIASYEQGEAL